MKTENNFAENLLAKITKKANKPKKTKKTNKVELSEDTKKHLKSVEKKLFEVIKVPLSADIQAIKLPEIPTLPDAKNSKNEKLESVKNLIKKVKLEISKILKLKKAEADGDIFFLPPVGSFGIYKTTGGNSLGIMGNDFTPMQPIEFFNVIVETVKHFGADLDLNTLQFKQFLNGRKIEFSIKMHPISFKNNKKVDDITNLELTFSTSYDGTKSNIITLYTERLVCTNGMVAKGIQGYIKGRNTLGGKTKILTFVEELAEIINSGKEFKKKMIELDKRKVTKEEIETFKLNLFGYNRETLDNDTDEETGEVKANTFKHKFLDNVEEAFAEEFERTGETLFGLLQGATNYTNHYAERKEQISKDEYIRFFQGAKVNDKAQELVFAMA